MVLWGLLSVCPATREEELTAGWLMLVLSVSIGHPWGRIWSNLSDTNWKKKASDSHSCRHGKFWHFSGLFSGSVSNIYIWWDGSFSISATESRLSLDFSHGGVMRAPTIGARTVYSSQPRSTSFERSEAGAEFSSKCR